MSTNHEPGHEVATTDAATGASLDRFENPGHPEHKPRLGDSDPKAAKRAERQVVVLFAISVIGTLGFVVAYFALPPGETPESMRLSNFALGMTMAFALLGIGTGAIHWAKSLMNDREKFEDRHVLRSDDETRAAAVAALTEGAKDANIGRRGVLQGAVVGALALFPISIVLPLIGNIGEDWDVSKFKHTMWKKGTRLAYDPSGRLIKASDVTIGSVVHVIPDGLHETEHPLDEKAKAVVLLIRMDPRDLKTTEKTQDWVYDGIVAYSKICTHVGCPVALYEQQTHHILCPCHQSTFDAADGAKVVFGPAKRPLPMLPIAVDDEGYLIAQDDFDEPIGPSFWERLS